MRALFASVRVARLLRADPCEGDQVWRNHSVPSRTPMRFHSLSRIVSTHGSPARIGQDSRERLRRLLEPDAPPPRRTPTQLLRALLQRSTHFTALLLFLGLCAAQPLRAIEFPPRLTNDTKLTNIVVITNDIPIPAPIVTFPSPVSRNIGAVPVSIHFL